MFIGTSTGWVVTLSVHVQGSPMDEFVKRSYLGDDTVTEKETLATLSVISEYCRPVFPIRQHHTVKGIFEEVALGSL